ncbi:spermatogenesis-associated protein 7-like [Uloborus diversus]|uniref:spermatogenesis-associated protein 7-like n=1 Tax=Uloborus diversus TaxID=327109 RepID=UPI00240A3E3A|nr:spermatogenesis-associated protein 7-like [Uloborus diversus]
MNDISSLKAKKIVNYSDEDDFFNVSEAGDFVTLSHLNNKSSALCPETQNITSQYLILQQLNAHQRMISRAKGVVDTSPPKSLQSYISITDRKKKGLRQRTRPESLASGMNDFLDDVSLPSSSRSPHQLKEDANESLRASSVNKAIQAGIPFSASRSTTADKISWYLEALKNGDLFSHSLLYAEPSSIQLRNEKFRMARRKKIKGDLMKEHREQFIRPKKPFCPRILANPNAKSKLKEMHCYNPPVRKKKITRSHSSDTFESYEDEDTASEEKAEAFPVKESVDEETQMSRRFLRNHDFFYNKSSQLHNYQENQSNYSGIPRLNENEEDKYLNFLSKVTEDILRSGVYSDRAIQRAFDFHRQFHQNDGNEEKLQSLLEQVLDGLKISNDEPEDIVYHKRKSFLSSQLYTPPEKEYLSNNSLGSMAASSEKEDEEDFQSRIQAESDVPLNETAESDSESESKYS